MSKQADPAIKESAEAEAIRAADVIRQVANAQAMAGVHPWTPIKKDKDGKPILAENQRITPKGAIRTDY